jgi:RimJ/RimL family protein N-acetyltransferase
VTEWPVAEPIRSARVELEPLRAGHAGELAGVLDDPRLHEFTGGRPATVDELRDRYARQVAGRSPDGRQGWLNWVVRRRDTGEPVGTVQATLVRAGGRTTAELAWVVAVGQQGRGYAREAALAMSGWLARQGVTALAAHVHPDHRASAAVARRLGMRPTPTVVDGETRWST